MRDEFMCWNVCSAPFAHGACAAQRHGVDIARTGYLLLANKPGGRALCCAERSRNCLPAISVCALPWKRRQYYACCPALGVGHGVTEGERAALGYSPVAAETPRDMRGRSAALLHHLSHPACLPSAARLA